MSSISMVHLCKRYIKHYLYLVILLLANFFLIFQEWQKMCELAKMFIHCLNHWKLETPNTWKQHQPNADLAQYRMNYTRYFLL